MIESIQDAVKVITLDDWQWMGRALGSYGRIYKPDLVIAPDGHPYLFRWYLTPKQDDRPGAYLHMQVESDPERPYHDHPWDNTSHIVSGGYVELLQSVPPDGAVERVERRRGDVVHRAATEAHRLLLLPGVPYTLSLFTHGPVLRPWGFWYGDAWHDAQEHVAMRNGVSVHVNRGLE